MFATLVRGGESLQKAVKSTVEKREEIDMRELVSCFTTNVIASIAFGLDVDAIADPDTPFRKYGRKFCRKIWKEWIKKFSKILFTQT